MLRVIGTFAAPEAPMSRRMKSKMPTFDEAKFKELILYIADQCCSDRYWSATKLNKVLFYSDFLYYQETGRSITGAEYQALEYGPAPKKLLPIRQKLVDEGALAIDQRKFQHRVVPLRNPDLTNFAAQEIAIVNKVINCLKNASAETVSELSHAFLGWKAAWTETEKSKEPVTIPYGTVFVDNPPIDEFEEAHGFALAKKYGW